MSDPVLSQLVSVESDLAQQVDSLESQLAQIQARREGLRTVIAMFEGGEDETSSNLEIAETTATAPSVTTARKPGRPPGSKTTSRAAATKTTQETTQAVAKKTPGRKPKSSTASTQPKATKSASQKKKDGRAADWQKYVQPEYRESALPEAVSSVLRSAPSEVFKIADVMSSIFIEDVPRDQFLKARNRISNILSAGARDGSWYRGRNGRYSQSENATK